MKVLLSTLAGNLFLFLGSAAYGAAAVLASIVPPRGHLVYPVACAWSRALLFFSGVRLQVRKPPPPAAAGPFVFMANHQSLYDIPAILASLPSPSRFLAKRSLFRIPLFGWALAAGGFVPVDRSDRSRAAETFAAATAAMEKGDSIVVFPEETRSTDGRLRPFRRGGFLMALKLGRPIVPVGVSGSLAVRRKGAWRVRPGTIEIAYGDPVDPQEYGLRRRKELVGAVEQEVARLCGAPVVAAPAESVASVAT